MISIDLTYQPRPWRCEECGALLGFVLRDANRIRRLWVLRVQKKDLRYQPTDAEIIASAETERQGRAISPQSMWRVRGLAGNATVGCDDCGSLQEWYPNEEELVDLIRRVRGEEAVKKFRRLMQDR
jgi:hypothetical protein